MTKAIYLLLFFPLLTYSQAIVWNDTIIVNSDISKGFSRPKIALSNSGPIIMWGRAANREIFVSTWNGSGFDTARQVTPNGLNAFVQNWAGPSLASQGDTCYIAMKAQPESVGVVYVLKSTDGGENFSDTLRVSSENWSRFPEVTVDEEGNPIVTFMEHDSAWHEPRYIVYRSTDMGDSFSKITTPTIAGEACDCCPGFITSNNEHVLVLFRNNDNNLREIWGTSSNDGGLNFNSSGRADTTGWIVSGCPSSGPDAEISGDSAISVWMSNAGLYASVYVSKFSVMDFGMGKHFEVHPGVSGNQNYPKVAMRNEKLGIVWQENQVGNNEILFVYSNTELDGLPTSEIDTVNINSAGAQINPDVAFDGETFHFVWQDQNRQRVVYRSATIQEPVGFESTDHSHLDLYPNPVQDILNVQWNSFWDENVAYTLLDISGKVMLNGILQGETHKINTKPLPSGVYLIKIGDQVGRFIK